MQPLVANSSAPARRGTLRPFSVAPMMDRSDRHYRYFARLLTRRALLYTEMVTTGAILHGDRERLLRFSAEERPLALQLGGDDPGELAACARIAAEWGYDEVDLNVGCPSERVQKGSFGVCLMARPERVAEAVAAMRAAAPLPVTVKHRIGFDEFDRYEDMAAFVRKVAAAGADRFIVHARKAWLSGLSPKENREVPPLRYADVHRLKRELPHLAIEINGGFTTLAEASGQLVYVDGVMVGRAAYEDPWMLAGVDREVFGEETPPPSRRHVVTAMLPYVEAWRARGEPLARITRHLLGLFAGQPGARAWRRRLGEEARLPGAGPELLTAALAAIPDEVLDARPEVGTPALAAAEPGRCRSRPDAELDSGRRRPL
jgi:tRNA-dihydrouridine synthase A